MDVACEVEITESVASFFLMILNGPLVDDFILGHTGSDNVLKNYTGVIHSQTDVLSWR